MLKDIFNINVFLCIFAMKELSSRLELQLYFLVGFDYNYNTPSNITGIVLKHKFEMLE